MKTGWGLSPLLNSYAEIFFLRSPWVGAVILMATLTDPSVGLSGLLSVAAAYGFARVLGMREAFLASGFFTYNPLLVGLSIGYLFKLSSLSLFFVVTAGIFTLLVSVMLNSILATYLKLPILSLPFVLVSSIAYLAASGYSNLYVNHLQPQRGEMVLGLPLLIEGFLSALGAVLFLPNPLAGLLIALVMVVHSRILLLLGVLGYLLGTLLSGMMDGNLAAAWMDINSFNFILIAMAVGGVFMAPAPKGFLVAAVGVAMGVILLDAVNLFWARYGLPAFTLPFNMVTLTLLYVLGLVGFPLVVASPRATPEETLDEFISLKQRFHGDHMRRLQLPFSGPWHVWQGFDGGWTHQGVLRYAYDFVIEKKGSTFRGAGDSCQDYYAFGKPVFAPIRGRVVKVVGGVADNQPGQLNEAENWGNLIVLDSTLGYWVLVCHFAQDSLCVEQGQWVEVGTQLGLCGNSGYSPQPHIHIQVQNGDTLGCDTLPFSFQGYQQAGQFMANDQPEQGATVEPLCSSQDLDRATTFMLDQSFIFETQVAKQPRQLLELRVEMSELGERALASDQGRLYFSKDHHQFYFYRLEGSDPWLATLFAALPRVPLVDYPQLIWQDQPPMAATQPGWQGRMKMLVKAVRPSAYTARYEARWQGPGHIVGQLQQADGSDTPVEIVIDPVSGIQQVMLGSRSLKAQSSIVQAKEGAS
ncbi:urea transporter [Magnetococcus sp. PR-3]|uniref:urea transporter n=1 Tax=Magnetococcus sp. PR-3 TaxID=3120355 RepID=UPI002FCE289E